MTLQELKQKKVWTMDYSEMCQKIDECTWISLKVDDVFFRDITKKQAQRLLHENFLVTHRWAVLADLDARWSGGIHLARIDCTGQIV